MKTLTLEHAIKIATNAHAGQRLATGQPYIEHPLAVMDMVEGDAKIIAVLHDVLEDTDVTIDDLRAEGATEDQITALRALTHGRGERYDSAVLRALTDKYARPVKIADYDHNTDPVRLALLDKTTAERLRSKYARVAGLIEQARLGELPDMPDHRGTCDCPRCNEAYGARKTR